MVRQKVTDSSTTKMFHRLPHELFQIVVQYLGVEKCITEARDKTRFLFESIQYFGLYRFASIPEDDDTKLRACAILHSIKSRYKRWYIMLEIKTRARDGMLLKRRGSGLM